MVSPGGRLVEPRHFYHSAYFLRNTFPGNTQLVVAIAKITSQQNVACVDQREKSLLSGLKDCVLLILIFLKSECSGLIR